MRTINRSRRWRRRSCRFFSWSIVAICLVLQRSFACRLSSICSSGHSFTCHFSSLPLFSLDLNVNAGLSLTVMSFSYSGCRLFVCLFTCLLACLFVYLFVCLFDYLFTVYSRWFLPPFGRTLFRLFYFLKDFFLTWIIGIRRAKAFSWLIGPSFQLDWIVWSPKNRLLINKTSIVIEKDVNPSSLSVPLDVIEPDWIHWQEYDLEQKIDVEIRIREGTTKLLAACEHPSQALEAAKTLQTSNERMNVYMNELQVRKRAASSSAASASSAADPINSS